MRTEFQPDESSCGIACVATIGRRLSVGIRLAPRLPGPRSDTLNEFRIVCVERARVVGRTLERQRLTDAVDLIVGLALREGQELGLKRR